MSDIITASKHLGWDPAKPAAKKPWVAHLNGRIIRTTQGHPRRFATMDAALRFGRRIAQ